MLGLVTYSDELGVWQKSLADLYERMADHSRKYNGAISARHLESLRTLVGEFHDFHQPRLKRFFAKERDYLEHGIILKLSKGKSKITTAVRHTPLLTARNRSSRGSIRFRGTRVSKFLINPNDDLGRQLLGELKLQFAAKIMLFEAYTLGLSPFIETKAFRGVLLRDIEDDESTETLESLWFEAVEQLFKRELLMKRLGFIQSAEKVQKDSSKMEQALDSLLEKSVVIDELQKRREDFSFFRNMAKNMSFMAKRRWDAYRELGVSTLYQGSKLFGNTAGLFQSRRGYLHSWTKEQENQIAGNLKPLDLIFDKTPFSLTDKFIPG
ncbi:MAG: hypothetical protein NXH75_16295, partial [Halobacteriovoraceae bacterium]|nr:hypothetical protein [Halobacteriovoraceae bacterium]